MRATIYLHASKESCRDVGVKLGLTGIALEHFMFAGYEHRIDGDVNDKAGEFMPTHLNGRSVEPMLNPVKEVKAENCPACGAEAFNDMGEARCSKCLMRCESVETWNIVAVRARIGAGLIESVSGAPLLGRV
jgi:hypothetical protein